MYLDTRLALDVGTNSIGWAVVSAKTTYPNGERKEALSIKNHEGRPMCGVVVFKECPKASDRRVQRGARRIVFRRKLRLYETLKALSEHGMCPVTLEEVEKWRQYKNPVGGKTETFIHYPSSISFREWLKVSDGGKNPYHFRHLAATEKFDLTSKNDRYMLGRAFYHMAHRRGFKSNRLADTDKGEVEQYIPFVEEVVAEADGAQSLLEGLKTYFGGFDKDVDKAMVQLGKRLVKTAENEKGLPFEEVVEKVLKRLHWKENLGAVKRGINEITEQMEQSGAVTLGSYLYGLHRSGERARGRYTAREEHYLAEFEHICSLQGITGGLKESLHNAIFYQRELRSQSHLVGKCPLEPNKARAFLSHPVFEEFRMWQKINTIKFRDGDGKMVFLPEAERLAIVPLFQRRSKTYFPFSDIKAALPEGRHYNYKDDMTFTGCPTIAFFKRLWGEDWEETMHGIEGINRRRDGSLKERQEVIEDVWHFMATAVDEKKVSKYASDKLGLEGKDHALFCNARLVTGHASLSIGAIKKILPFLKGGMIYSDAVYAARLPELVGSEKWRQSGDMVTSEVKRILQADKEDGQMIYIVNGLIKTAKRNGDVYSKEAETYFVRDAMESLGDGMGEGLSEKIVDLFLGQMKKNGGTGAFIKKATVKEKIEDFLNDNGLLEVGENIGVYEFSQIENYPPAVENADGFILLPSPEHPSINNPVVLRAMHHIKKLVNRLLKEDVIDQRTKVIIEMGRDMATENEREAINQSQSAREKENQEYRDAIDAFYGKKGVATDQEVEKYRLWTEQGKKCVYTGNEISIADFLGKDPLYDIEHTVPRSKSLDNSLENKTLACKVYNREVKKGSLPANLQDHEKIMLHIAEMGWDSEIAKLKADYKKKAAAAKMATDPSKKSSITIKKHRLKMELDYWEGKRERFTMKEVEDKFTNGQKVDNGFIARKTASYLKTVFKNVRCVKPKMVSNFRHLWGIGKKDRSLHLHHMEDAIIMACMIEKYDLLAESWRMGNGEASLYVKKLIAENLPFDNFVGYLQQLKEGVLIYQSGRDRTFSKSAKKIRKNGKVLRDGNGKAIVQSSHSVRGALHDATFYRKRENGAFTRRVELARLKMSDVESIVDDNLKRRILAEHGKGRFKFAANGNVGDIFYPKGKKVKAVSVWSRNSAIEIKQQRDGGALYARPNGNFCVALYEGMAKNGKLKTDREALSLFDAAKTLREHGSLSNAFPPEKNGLPFKAIIKKGMKVIRYYGDKSELQGMDARGLSERLFVVKEVSASGIMVLHHTKVRSSVMEKDANGKMKRVRFIEPITQWKVLVEGIDFDMDILGRVSVK